MYHLFLRIKDRNAQPSYIQKYSERRVTEVKMVRLLFLTLALAVSATATFIGNTSPTSEVANWRNKYTWYTNFESDLARRTAVHNNYAFLAFPRSPWSDKPVTLARMSLGHGNHSELVSFPNSEWQTKYNCGALQNVVDVFVDSRGLLWALDFANAVGGCEAKIVSFDSTTGKMVRILQLSTYREWSSDSTPGHIVVDYDIYGNFFVFVSDIQNRKIAMLSQICGFLFNLPETFDVNQLADITLNLVQNSNRKLLLINDEGQKQMFFLELGVIERCLPIYGNPLQDMGSSHGTVLLGNDNGGIVYFRSGLQDPTIYKYDPFIPKSTNIAYQGNSFLLTTPQVVADYADGRVFILELYPKSLNGTLMLEQSLTNIQ